MWLPKDERLLLAGYYRELGEVEKTETYSIYGLRSLLSRCPWKRKVRESGDPDKKKGSPADNVRWVNQYFDVVTRIRKANKHLAERRLLVTQEHKHDNNVILISLTVDGYDLGRKYASWFNRTGLLFDEYKHHWLWLIVALLGGGIVSKLLDRILPGIFGNS